MDIKKINWQQTIPIRHAVLWPNENPSYVEVEGDADALHFGVFVADGIICVASVFIDGESARLRKFATLPAFQGKGLGSYMLRHLITELKTSAISYLWLDARASAVEYYQRFGFTVEGVCFYKNQQPYYKMYKHL